MLNRVRALVSKLRYINRLIIEIEQKETQLLAETEMLRNSLQETHQCLDFLRDCLSRSVKEEEDFQEEILKKVVYLESSYRQMSQYVNMEYLTVENRKEKKYLLVGFYGAVNLGDELMLRKVYGDMETVRNQLYVMMCDNSGLNVFQYPGMNILHYPKTKYDYSHLANIFDGVIFGGGAIIDDTQYHLEESYQYDLGKIFIELAEAFVEKNKKVYALALSTNEKLADKLYMDKLKHIIEKSEHFSVRDKYSAQLLQGITGKSVSVMNDIVLTYDLPDLSKAEEEIYRIGIIWICHAELKEEFERFLHYVEEVYSGKKIEIRLIPFYNFCDCDQRFYDQICKQMKSNVVSIAEMPLDFYDIYKEVYNCDLIISMRYHGALIGLMSGRTTMALLYRNHRHYYNKMTDLFEKFECSENLFDSLDELERQLPVLPRKKAEIYFDNKDYEDVIQNIIRSVEN